MSTSTASTPDGLASTPATTGLFGMTNVGLIGPSTSMSTDTANTTDPFGAPSDPTAPTQQMAQMDLSRVTVNLNHLGVTTGISAPASQQTSVSVSNPNGTVSTYGAGGQGVTSLGKP